MIADKMVKKYDGSNLTCYLGNISVELCRAIWYLQLTCNLEDEYRDSVTHSRTWLIKSPAGPTSGG